MARSTNFLFSLFSILALAAAPSLTHAQTPSAGQDCLHLAAAKIDWSDQTVSTKHRKIWLETCRQAYAANADDPRIKLALAGALQNRAESVPLLRAAAVQNDTEAMLAFFNDFNSFDRNLNRPDLIPRAEAEKVLRGAAEKGDREAICGWPRFFGAAARSSMTWPNRGAGV